MSYQSVIGLILIITDIEKVLSLMNPTLSMPRYAREGSDIPFHCKYSVPTKSVAELDVKVYHGESPSPLLVFLPSLKQVPQIVDQKFQKLIFFSETNTFDGRSELKLTFKNLRVNMSGLFTCKVSTNTAEMISTRRLTVYSKCCFCF